MNIRITGEDGQPLAPDRLAVRQIAGVMILEGSFMLRDGSSLPLFHNHLSSGFTKR